MIERFYLYSLKIIAGVLGLLLFPPLVYANIDTLTETVLPADSLSPILSLVIVFLLFFVMWTYWSNRQQKNSLKEAKKLKQHMGVLLNSSVNEIYIFEKCDFKFIDVSKGALDNLGYSQKEIQQLTAVDIKPEFSLEKFKKAIEPLLELTSKLIIFETIHQRKNGSTYPVEVHLQLMDTEEGSQFMAVILDISERKNAENNLKEKEEHHRDLLESTAAIPWEIELPAWRFTYIGPQIENITGFTPEEWYAENFLWDEHLDPEDREATLLFCKEATARHEDHEFEYRFIKKDGSMIWIRDTVQVIVEEGTPVILRGFMFDITKQKNKQIQADLRLAETQEIAHVGSWDFDMLNNKLVWSDETYKIFEIDPSEGQITYDKFVEVIHPDDRQLLESTFQNAIQENQGYKIEHRLLFANERIKYIHGRGQIVCNSNGEPVRAYGSVQDITDKKRADEAINTIASMVSGSEDKDFFHELVVNMAEMFESDYAFIGLLDDNNKMQVNTYVVYGHGKIVPNISYSLVNTPCVNVVGKEACAYPEHVQQLFPDDKMLVDMGVESYIGLPLFSSDKKAIGLVVILDSRPMKNTEQMENLLTIFAARTEAELERKKTNETIQKLSLVVEQSPNIIIITNAEGVIEYVNPAFTETTGYSSEEVLNKTPALMSSGEMPESFYHNLWQTIQKGETWEGVFYNKRSNGELYWDEAKISPIKNTQGETTHFLGVQSDITDKKQMEQQLRRSQKMDSLGKLTGGIAHDYNNMLNVILGYTELLEMVVTGEQEEKANEFIKEIKHAADRGASLTKKLLAFSRQESDKPESVDVNNLLLDSKNMLKKTLTARINLDYQLDKNIWPIFLDKGDLEDALLNICINAMHAMPDGGDLTLTSRNRDLEKDEAAILNLAAGEYVQVSIEDTGVGIDDDVLNQIFDPFFTTKGELGTGLGLTQVYGFIKRSKGAISIDSNINIGTYINIYLPRYFSSVKEDEISSDVISDKGGNETILIVDDEVAICELSNKILSTKGYKTFVAHNGEEALDILSKNNIDLMLSDVIMPKMDGYKLASKVRKKYPSTKIQLVSGFDDDKQRTPEDAILAENLLHKPYSAKELIHVIRKLLDVS